jgi:hypothetical protein
MMRMPKTAPVAMLLVLLLQVGGLWMGIKSLQAFRIVQQELRTQSNPDNAVSFTISKARFEACALDDGKELSLDGSMFDVISVTEQGDSVHITALEDHLEARLIAWLMHSSQPNDKNAQGDAYLFALMHLNFVLADQNSIRVHTFISEPACNVDFIHPYWDDCALGCAEQPPESKG